MSKLDNRVAVVTGGARGIGRAYALRLARLGADVAILDINLKSFEEYEAEREALKAETVMDEIKKLGRRSIGIEVDVSNYEEVIAAIDRVVEELGSIDILICNAGVGTGPFGGSKASEILYDDLHKTIERNLFSTIYTCMAASKHMKKKGHGKIVTVSSQAGVMPAGASYAHYGTAKAGISMYTRYLAHDLGPYGINVNCVAPGLITSGQWVARVTKEGMNLEEMAKKVPLRRLGTPEDCAGVIEFLCTDLSDYVTGQVIGINGGTVICPH